MSDLTIKAIKVIYNNKTLTYEQIRRYKIYGKEFINGLRGIYIRENIALPITMDCRTSTAVEFKSKLGFKQHNIIMTKEQSVITNIMKVFCGKEKKIYNILFQAKELICIFLNLN